MNSEKRSFFEKVIHLAHAILREYRSPIVITWLVGLLAHMFTFTNKLLNFDEPQFLFSKGITLPSGRWMLGLTSFLFPDVSMPWIYGTISLALVCVAVCLIIRIYEIKNTCIQGILAGLIVCFPGQVSIFCFMFTSAPYALSFLLSVLSVYIVAVRTKPRKYVFSCVALYIKLHMDYENTYAFYTVLASDIKKSDQYREGMTVYIAGEAEDGVLPKEAFGLDHFDGPAPDLLNAYTKAAFINYYIGYDITILPFEAYHIRASLEGTETYASMPAYPAEGSISTIDGYLVVKLG